MTTTTSGETPIAAELLEKLTPEQRARMEERMKANSGEKTRTLTYKRCMTKEDIDKGVGFGQDQGKCTPTVVSSTGSAVDVQIACTQVGMTSSGAIHFEALSPESMKGSAQMTMTGSGHTMTVHMILTSRWIGPTCSKTD